MPVYIRTREPHPWGATAATAGTTHARGHNTIAPPHELPVPVPAVYERPCFFFFFHQKKTKIRGGEEGHNHQWHTRTAHSAHTGELAPRGPGHCTRACTEGNKGTRHYGLAHR